MTAAPPVRLLIVDDEAAQMKALCDTLTEHGYAPSGFTSPTKALAAVHAGSFELLLTDLMMPEMDGITLLRSALKVDPNLVGVLMTGHGSVNTAVDSMKVGALDYILKPFRLSAILPVISRALAVRRLRLENAVLEQRVRDRTEELETANSELEAFSYSVSHDLRAPLRHIEGFSNLLVSEYKDSVKGEALQLVNRINASSRRMGQLIDDLLQFSRLSKTPLAKQTVKISALVNEIVAELQNDHPGRKVTVKVGELPDAEGDPSLLKQVFVNLLSNAFKFTRGLDAVIEVGYEDRAGEKTYYIRDNGVGFDMQYATRLFSVFQRLHSAEKFEGTGVGLSIVQRIVQRHGGRIWAEAEVNKGATFYFTLAD
jgi:hypothetical protein